MTANPVPNKPAATKRPFLRRALLGLLVLLAVPASHAATPDAPADSTTHHRYKIGEADVAFTATAATFPLTNDKGERQAGIFHVAYTRHEASAPRRPITFVFISGPDPSSAHLPLGSPRPP